MTNIRNLFVFGILLMTGTWVFSGEISGRAIDSNGFYISNVTIVLNHEDGLSQSTKTDASGSYQFQRLDAGNYFLYAENPSGYELLKPPCGSYYDYLEGDEHIERNFQFGRGVGVVLDFGSPGYGFSGLTMSGGSFNMSLFATGLPFTGPNYANTIEIVGYWHAAGAGTLHVNGVSASPTGPYAGSSITSSFTNLGGGYIKIILHNATAPGFNLDGELATFSFSLDPFSQNLLNNSTGNVTFCMTSVTFISNNIVVKETADQFVGTID